MCTTEYSEYSAYRSQNRVLNLLELELQAGVSHYLGAEATM